jgi:Rieske Fe-S protein
VNGKARYDARSIGSSARSTGGYVQRRHFMKLCMAGAALAPCMAPAAELQARSYARTQLVDERGAPIKTGTLARGVNYIFHYPYAGTPCFLIDLGRSTQRNVRMRTERGDGYQWPGGVGPRSAVVAYSAICTHRMTYPTRQISFISYRDRSNAPGVAHPNTIHCCSEHSEFDPAAGAQVVAGPAPQPLAAVLLDYDPASDALYAVGTLGSELFNAFFAKYEMKLALEHGGADRVRQPVRDTTVVTELASYCKQQIRC